MRLTGLDLDKYRRFASASLDLSEPLVALTGPNEAGKSSLLRAIRLLDEKVQVVHRDTTRGADIPDNHILVRGFFRLDAGDRAAIAHLDGADAVQYFILCRRLDGTFVYAARPAPVRSTSTLDAAVVEITQVSAKLRSRKRNPAPEAIAASLDRAADALEKYKLSDWQGWSDDGALNAVAQQLSDAITGADLDEKAEQVIGGCVRAIQLAQEARSEIHPHQAMRSVLFERRPSVIPFLESERDLRATYDLNDDEDNVPDALVNIAALAKLSLADVKKARELGDHGRVHGLLEAANSELERALSNWSQSSLTLRLFADEATLRLMVTTPDRSWLTEITERSDGLRSYIALVAAIAWARRETASQRPTLLLLDEAEQHLHYDAQADLVEVLTSGRLANQVVYTTHSAGCLPEDLGASVRVVLPDQDQERSRIQNWFWESGPGFSPLIFGMGASSLAFSSARRAVLTEGASDTIALPSLLREALSADRLGYQIAPGLAEVGASAAAELDLEAARVVYLVDGDGAGRGIRDKLTAANVKDKYILSLGGNRASGTTLEDLVTPTAFRQAMIATLSRNGPLPPALTIPTPQNGRAAAAKKACLEAGLAPPSKRILAQELVVLAREGKVLSTRGAQTLRKLHAQIADLLMLA